MGSHVVILLLEQHQIANPNQQVINKTSCIKKFYYISVGSFKFYLINDSCILFQLEHDLQEYDHPANQSFSHTWLEDFGQQRTVFYPSSGYAIDANTTFLVC